MPVGVTCWPLVYLIISAKKSTIKVTCCKMTAQRMRLAIKISDHIRTDQLKSIFCEKVHNLWNHTVKYCTKDAFSLNIGRKIQKFYSHAVILLHKWCVLAKYWTVIHIDWLKSVFHICAKTSTVWTTCRKYWISFRSIEAHVTLIHDLITWSQNEQSIGPHSDVYLLKSNLCENVHSSGDMT